MTTAYDEETHVKSYSEPCDTGVKQQMSSVCDQGAKSAYDHDATENETLKTQS